MWLLEYLQLCLVIICWTWLFCTQIYSQHENYLKTGGTRGRNTAIIRETRTAECSRASFQICLPCQEKALLQWQPRGVCYNRKIIWDAKLKSQSQVKNRGSRGVHIHRMLFSFLEEVGSALSLQRWCCEVSSACGRVVEHPPSTVSFLGSAQSSDSPVTTQLQCPKFPQPGSCSPPAKPSPIWPSALELLRRGGCTHSRGRRQDRSTLPPSPQLLPAPTQSTVLPAPADPTKGRFGGFLWCPKAVWGSAAGEGVSRTRSCVRVSSGEHKPGTCTQPRLWTMPGDNLSRTCQDPDRIQVGFLQAQSTAFLNYAPRVPLLPANKHFFPLVAILASNPHYYSPSLDNHTLTVPLTQPNVLQWNLRSSE